MAHVQLADGVLHYQLDGPADAPVLVLSNSLGTDLRMWDEQVPIWTEHFRVLRHDTRGHGESLVTEGPYSIEQLGATSWRCSMRWTSSRPISLACPWAGWLVSGWVSTPAAVCSA